MKKIIRLLVEIVAFYFFIIGINNACALDDITATKELIEVFNGAKSIDITLVTRNTLQAQYGPIQLDEIALVFANLAVSLYPEQKYVEEIEKRLINLLLKDPLLSKYRPDLPNVSGYLDFSQYQNSSTAELVIRDRKEKIIKKFNECLHASKYKHSLNDNSKKWKIIIFNETFFSKNTPLTLQEIKVIKELFTYFLSFDERVILYMNFLYMTNNELMTKEQRNSLVSLTLAPTTTMMKRILFSNNDIYNDNSSDLIKYLQIWTAVKDFSKPLPIFIQ